MFKCTFNTLEELKNFLSSSDYGEVKFCVDPDCVDAIIGISDEEKVVYDYEKMVEHLASIYQEDSDIEEPYESASEWIDHNCQEPYWEVVYTYSPDDVTLGEYEEGFRERFSDYVKTVIGVNSYGYLLLDSELVKDYNIDDIETILKDCEITYNII